MKLFKLGGRNCCSTVFSVDVGGSKSVMHKKWEEKNKIVEGLQLCGFSIEIQLKIVHNFQIHIFAKIAQSFNSDPFKNDDD